MLAFPGAVGLGQLPQGDVRINEFLASNDAGLLDEDGESSDWIELENVGAATVDLGGWSLSDEAAAPTLWTLPTTNLAPGEFLIVFASAKDRAQSGQELHTNFKLSAPGEDLLLVEPDGVTVASSFIPFPPQTTDVSYGIKDLTLEEGYFSPPTPGEPNGDEFVLLEGVTFSHARGYKDAPFTLTLSHSDPAAVIRYSLDGSPPFHPDGQKYTGPLAIARSTIVRAKARKPGYDHSAVGTQTYLFPTGILAQSDAAAVASGFPAEWIEEDGTNWTLNGNRPGAWYGMDTAVLGLFGEAELRAALLSAPAMSLSMPIDDFFGDGLGGAAAGIYCNSESGSSEWVRAGSAELIDPGGGPEFQVDCGIAIQGSSSTAETIRNQLSIALHFKSKFGPPKLKFPVFAGSPVESFDFLILDAGNQNSPNSASSVSTKRHAQGLRDQLISDLLRNMGSSSPRGRPVHLFLNGLYWGLYVLHEKADEQTAAAYGGNSPLEYDYVKEGALRSGNSNPWDHPTAPGAWNSAVEIAGGGLGLGDLWQGQPAYEAFAEWVDVADYARYLLVNYFGGNTDWPQNNWLCTSHSRLSPEWSDLNPEGAWHWHSWDAETVLYWGGLETLVGDGFYDRTGITSGWSGSAVYFYTALREHPEWRVLMGDIAHEQIFHGALFVDPAFSSAGTVFDPEHPERNLTASLYHDLAKAYWPGIILEYARWANYWHSPGALTPSDWQVERDRLLNEFFPVRTDVLLAQLRNVQPRLYPLLDAPVLSQYGGHIEPDEQVTLSGPPGATIYYTVDGSDPRLEGGSVNPSAQVYSGPFLLTGPTVSVKARSNNGAQWSALERGNFAVGVRVRINELQASNTTTILDEMGQAEDWAELINPADTALDLDGFGLSDDPTRPGKWRFPAGAQIPARGFLLVWLDEDQLDGPLHANFKLAASGEQLSLCGPANTGNVPLDSVSFKAQQIDASLGRIPNASGPFRALPDPTPGAPNLYSPWTVR